LAALCVAVSLVVLAAVHAIPGVEDERNAHIVASCRQALTDSRSDMAASCRSQAADALINRVANAAARLPDVSVAEYDDIVQTLGTECHNLPTGLSVTPEQAGRYASACETLATAITKRNADPALAIERDRRLHNLMAPNHHLTRLW
jgi:hypothetical protein